MGFRGGETPPQDPAGSFRVGILVKKSSQRQLASGHRECNLDLVMNGWEIRAVHDWKNSGRGGRGRVAACACQTTPALLPSVKNQWGAIPS